MNKILSIMICAGMLSMFSTGQALASPQEGIAKELTTYYRAARGVISKNQKHINNPDVGNKGLSGNQVVDLANANYKKATGKSFDASSTAGKAMQNAVRSVMGDAQGLINEKGKGFKGFLPAVFAGRVAANFSTAMNGKMKIKLTAPKNYVRNRRNRPDSWEANVIENKFRSSSYEKGKPFTEVADSKGKSAFRYILPEYYKQSCLACHGGPKGSLDITGGKKEGGVLGELGGAISLSIFQ